ncbi:MAG: FAD-dependent oxidoreductase [Chthoniobacter sp.]|uniref:FAD-dependent oxidoreductase n=1 Tax=Chthoniobacter sp. TaxID=2510640 RepID=UPI0032A753B4
MDFDVVVAGGGSAGLAAAVASARLGARTLLIERNGLLGGMASAALVHSICGLYRLPNGTAAPVLANAGFAAEFAKRLLAAGGASGPMRMGRVEVLLQRPVAFAQLCDAIARETPHLEIRLQSEIVAAEAGSITLVWRGCTGKVTGQAFVDATGDAVLAAFRGAPCEMETTRLQRPAYIFALGGVEAGRLGDDARLRLARQISQAVKANTLPAAALGAHLRESPQAAEAFVTIDLDGGTDFNPLDAVCLSRLETEGREVAVRLAEFLRREVEGFAGSYVAAWPARAGVRESRRIVGCYRLEAEDLERGAQFEDTVAYAAWPMELRETATGPRLRFPTGEEPCGIPLRALHARDDEALFMAGRCISCSHEAQASVRVIGTCLATGEAAGLAAALKVLHGEGDAAAVNAAREKIVHEHR